MKYLLTLILLLIPAYTSGHSELEPAGRFWVIPLSENLVLSEEHCYNHKIKDGYKDNPILVKTTDTYKPRWVKLDRVRVGSWVWSPLNGWSKVTKIQLDGKIHTTHMSKMGDSGSGLYNNQGRLVGVLCGMWKNSKHSLYLGPTAIVDYIKSSKFKDEEGVRKFLSHYEKGVDRKK